jgi:hypothetical protein
MTLDEFREQTKDLPGDTVILVENEDPMCYYDVKVQFKLPPVLDHSWAVLLEPGQCWNYELDLDSRIDAKLGN